MRTAAEFPGQAAATKLSGASAALSISPRVTSERQIERIPAGHPGKRRTIAIRINSSNRPGRTMPMTEAPPPAAASESGPGRSGVANSRPHPQALSRKATRKSSATETSRVGSPREKGSGAWLTCRAASATSTRPTTVEPTAKARRPRLDALMCRRRDSDLRARPGGRSLIRSLLSTACPPQYSASVRIGLSLGWAVFLARPLTFYLLAP
jgi:hypothetical protein